MVSIQVRSAACVPLMVPIDAKERHAIYIKLMDEWGCHTQRDVPPFLIRNIIEDGTLHNPIGETTSV